jgi:hypothetical protein
MIDYTSTVLLQLNPSSECYLNAKISCVDLMTLNSRILLAFAKVHPLLMLENVFFFSFCLGLFNEKEIIITFCFLEFRTFDKPIQICLPYVKIQIQPSH